MRQPAVRCVDFVEVVTDWMEGALDDDARVELEEHLAICPHCAEYVEQLRLTTGTLRETSARHAPDAPPAEARAALLEAFRREHGTDVGT